METERTISRKINESSVSKANLHNQIFKAVLIGSEMKVENENRHLKPVYDFPGLIGNSQEMQNVYRLVSMVASTNSTVLLLGETGTGKEVIARLIHNLSPRKNKPMIAVNCAALPASLIESELFGHEKGAFTGAVERRIGKFELAQQSTIFLDEIGELPIELQVKILRVIQEREFERIGGKVTIKVDIRIIAATNRDLEAEVNNHRFRADLYYRLNVFPISLPALRKRLDDIVPLAEFFLSHYCKSTGRKISSVSNKVIQQLKSHSWPGNVRELEHFMERSVLLTKGQVLNEITLPVCSIENKQDIFHNKTLQQVERNYIIEVLRRCNGRISGEQGAAVWLDIPSTTVHSKMKKLRILKADYLLQKD